MRSWANAMYTTSNGDKYLYYMISSQVFFVVENLLDTTFLHEVGHSLGWEGHSNGVYDIMYTYGDTRLATSISNADKRHIDQIY